jgi:hypothetical protein
MLLVVFGAGASYDSVPHLRVPSDSGEKLLNHNIDRPPLAQELFEHRPKFVSVMERFGRCREIIPLLRKRGIAVEQELARIQSQAEKFPHVHSELAAIRYYLRYVLFECQNRWQGQHSGITNYATLVREIERWRYEGGEEVCFVTFNYDTMLEDAMLQVLGFTIATIDAYVSQQHYRVVKLHGSTNWGRAIDGIRDVSQYSFDRLIAEAATLRISDRFKWVDGPNMYNSGPDLVSPALAIPVDKKDDFACPPGHVEALGKVLRETTKIMTIGWRGTEDKFLAMLRSPLTGLTSNIDLLIVSGSPSGREETFKNLGISIAADRYGSVAAGFTGLINNLGTLDAFLRQTPWQKGR